MNSPTIPDSTTPEASPVDLSADLRFLHERGLLEPLLADRTTNAPIVWATDAYSAFGLGYLPHDPITPEHLLSTPDFVLRSRAAKDRAAQSSRTKTHAEVFTPLAVCNRMLDALPLPVDPEALLDATCLEIACGEAPFLSTRYDAATGEPVPPDERRGLLDRKLRAAASLAATPGTFPPLALRAYRSTYGFEFQGDNLLIARVNLFMALFEAHPVPLPAETLREIALVLAANLVQMDGLSGTIPYPPSPAADGQSALFSLDDFPPPPPPKDPFALFDLDEVAPSSTPTDSRPPALWLDWRDNRSVHFPDPQNPSQPKENAMKFDYVIGNPPYQDEAIGDNRTFAPPIYHTFLDGAYQVSKTALLVHPARFLFDAGSTPHEWNRKMLADPHFKVLHYEPVASSFFPTTEIKGGVAITLHDDARDFGPIEIFTPYPELNAILRKVRNGSFKSLSNIVLSRTVYRLTDKMHQDHPEAIDQLSQGHPYDVSTNILERLPQIFHTTRPNDDLAYIRIFGRVENTRVYRFIRRDYVNRVMNLDKWKVFLPKSNGAGAFDVFSTPTVAPPEVGHTETFMSIGCFDTEDEAQSCLKYICTKFARAMLGILKVTQDNPPEKWKYVPLQDFTSVSDIDWSQPVSGIDRQLYAKYGLSEEEIAFVETHVREME